MVGLYMFCVVILCHVTIPVTGQTGVNAKALRTQLFVTDGYDKRILPATNQTDPIEVYVDFFLLAINGLDEVQEVLRTTGFLTIVWYDGFLTWDPSNYGGLHHYFWPQDDVWKPDVALKNSHKQYKELGVDTLNVRVDSSGFVSWLPFQVFESTCSMNIKFFPFDVQTCALKFVAWSYSKVEVNMMAGSNGIILDDYEANSAWDVVDTSWFVKEESNEAEISFIIKMRRKPLFVILSIILPITLLAVLNIGAFLLPAESGERAGYSITVFLALAVFLTIVSSTLPANSDTVAVFSVYLIIQTVQSTLITLIVLGILRISSFGEDKTIPSCVTSMLRCADRSCCKKSNKVNQADTDNMVVHETKGSSKTQMGSNESLQGEQETKYTWNDVIILLDVVCIIFFLSVFVITTAVCFMVSIYADQ